MVGTLRSELSPRILGSIIPLSQNAFFLGEGQGVRVGEGIGPHPQPFSHRKKHSGRREQKFVGITQRCALPTLQRSC